MSNWHIPATPAPPRPWTDEEWTRAKAMMADGYGYGDIGARIGRTSRAVKAKFQKKNLTPAQRNARAEYQRRKRAEDVSRRQIEGLTFVRAQKNEVEQVILERNMRASLAPRDMTAAFFGDPLPGYSALDKRGARQ